MVARGRGTADEVIAVLAGISVRDLVRAEQARGNTTELKLDAALRKMDPAERAEWEDVLRDLDFGPTALVRALKKRNVDVSEKAVANWRRAHVHP